MNPRLQQPATFLLFIRQCRYAPIIIKFKKINGWLSEIRTQSVGIKNPFADQLQQEPIKISSNQFSKINISFKRCEYYTKNTHGCQNYRQYFQEKYPKICWFSSWVFNIEILVVVKIISFFSNV